LSLSLAILARAARTGGESLTVTSSFSLVGIPSYTRHYYICPTDRQTDRPGRDLSP
jgi:hypothetical protein